MTTRGIAFVAFFLFALAFVSVRAFRGFRSGGYYVAGRRVSLPLITTVYVGILVVAALFAATQFGIIRDYAPR